MIIKSKEYIDQEFSNDVGFQNWETLIKTYKLLIFFLILRKFYRIKKKKIRLIIETHRYKSSM